MSLEAKQLCSVCNSCEHVQTVLLSEAQNSRLTYMNVQFYKIKVSYYHNTMQGWHRGKI